MQQNIHFSQEVPYYAQAASRELLRPIIEEGFDPEQDPNWSCYGAANPGEYAHWVLRACGIICVKMCVEALGGSQLSVHGWIKRGLDRDGYLTVDHDGVLEERGWVHRVLAELIEAEGLFAQAVTTDLSGILHYLSQDRLFIASVSYQLGTRDPITFKGGHLVVVQGAELVDGEPIKIFLNNPSGRYPDLCANAGIPAQRFQEAYTGRGIVVGRSNSNALTY